MESVKKFYDLINEAGVFYLATVDGDQPRVRVYGASLLYDGKFYIMAMAGTNAPKQLAANPKAEICTMKGKILRMSCTFVEDSRPEVKQAMVDKMPHLKGALGEHGEGALMFYAKDATATISTMTETLETLTF